MLHLAARLVLFCTLAAGPVSSALGETAEEAARAVLAREAEFCRMGLETSTRAAFLEFLTDDSIAFEPGPVNAKQLWNGRAEGTISLKWYPTFVGVARSCDLAFTTGPAEWRKNKEDEKPFGHGQFITIWKKQPDGTWKVALDVGGPVPGKAKAEETLEIALPPEPVQTIDAKQAEQKLRQAEKWFATTAKTDSTAALIGASSETVRVHRERVFPAIGRDAASLMLSVRRGNLSIERLGGEMSSGGDLAYSYGKYSLQRVEKPETGHYLQVWRLQESGEWKLALDYQAPTPPRENTPARTPRANRRDPPQNLFSRR